MKDAAFHARVGQTIKGKWHLDGLLGVGGMAAVFAASHRNGQRAALKILHIDFAREKGVQDRFLREAYVSNKIGHSACVAVLDDDVTELGEPFLIMELLEGETLRDLWKRAGKRVPVEHVLGIAERILDCLVACHASGVIHRDLKPANIFITNESEVKVLDFGVAQLRDAAGEMTATGTALGTPAYMSPEQAMGLVDQLDGRTDLFSVGAMIHALATGKRINHGRTENEALIMAATTPVPSVAKIGADLPIDVIAIIDRSLAWDRRNRFADAKEMQAAVLAALAALASGVAARPEVHTSRPMPMPTIPSPSRGGSIRPPGASIRPSTALPPIITHAPGSAVEVTAAENDPRVVGLRDLFKQVDRLLPSVRQFGWDHPATERTLRTAFEAFAEALGKEPALARMAVRPYSLLTLGQTVWEPGPPFDSIPYNLFACGFRSLRIEPTITIEELRSVITLMMLDPGRDLPPEDDMAAAFWERGLQHVKYEVADVFAEGDATEREAFYSESDKIEEVAAAASQSHVSRIEAKAMAVSTDRSALRGSDEARGATPMALEVVVRAVYATQLEIPSERWSERFVDVLVEGYIDAAFCRDAALVLASMRRSSADLVVAGRLPVVIALWAALTERLGQRISGNDFHKLSGALTNAMFGAEALELALTHLRTHADQFPAFEPVLRVLSARELTVILGALRAGPDAALRGAILAYIERVAAGNEVQIGAAAAGLDPELACQLMALIARVGSPASKVVLASMGESEDMNVRLEAKVLAAGTPDLANAELVTTLESSSALLRMAALRAMSRHALRGAFPAVARHVKAPNFNELGTDERRELLRTLITLSTDHGEALLLEIVKKGGVFVSQSREGTRVVAAEVLGELSRSMIVNEALREVSQTRWGTSDDTRNAALAASSRVSARAKEALPAPSTPQNEGGAAK